MESHIIWIIAAVVMLILEVMTQAVWAFCIALGCLGAMTVSFFSDSPAMQVTVLGIVIILSYILFAPIIRKWEKERHTSRSMRTGMDALLGRQATVTQDIHPGELGRARIDGDYWQVKAPHATHTIKRGESVTVEAYESIILIVNTTEKEK